MLPRILVLVVGLEVAETGAAVGARDVGELLQAFDGQDAPGRQLRHVDEHVVQVGRV